ncbi:MAG: hypothetical protein K1W31_18415 [Lachnospiraceae bacterium]|jgi:hypothetical protein
MQQQAEAVWQVYDGYSFRQVQHVYNPNSVKRLPKDICGLRREFFESKV